MASTGNNQGTSASNPIQIPSSPEDRPASHAPAGPSTQPNYGTVAGPDILRLAPRPRPKREPDSSEGDTDSDLGARRTRAFRRSSGDRSSDSSAHGSSRPSSHTAGLSSNPIRVGESAAELARRRSSRSQIAHGHTGEREMRRASYAGNTSTAYRPPPVQSGQTMSRRPSGATPSLEAPTPRPAQAPAPPRLARLPSVVLPRWQPDNEVTYCPICHTQFSFFVRKHHCRKCGRVVCDACSPHRITIPYQYIVQPPGTPRLSRGEYPASLIAGEGGYADFSGLGGGERVRLCNPCVPDPNITPPQTQTPAPIPASRTGYVQSQGNVGQAPVHQSPLLNRLSAYMGAYGQAPEYSRSRSVTMGNQSTPVSPGPQQQPPSYGSRGPMQRAPASARPYRGPAPESSPVLVSGSVPSGSSSRNRALPAVPQASHPRRQIPEEDECPVCHRELPSRDLPNFEALREEHITSCIMSHSSGTPTQRGGVGVAPSAGESSTVQRRTGMFPYKATEKDCVDSAECSICLEEFEVGVDMARLECLCRFHRRCINAWFERHPGQCPMHQHDGMGF